MHSHPEAVIDDVFATHEFFDARDAVQVKYEMLRRVRVDDKPASHAAEAFGLSRVSYYKAKAAFEAGGVAALVPEKPGPRSAHKLTVEVMTFVRDQLIEDPKLTSPELAALIEKRFRINVHPRSIERALKRQKKKRP